MLPTIGLGLDYRIQYLDVDDVIDPDTLLKEMGLLGSILIAHNSKHYLHRRYELAVTHRP